MPIKSFPAHMESAGSGPTKPGRLTLTRQLIMLVIIGLTIATMYQLYHEQPHYRVQVFETATGWGYSIVNNGVEQIHQPTIPGLVGHAGFVNKEQAQRVGERVVSKLQQGQNLPTITPQELRQLGITIPE